MRGRLIALLSATVVCLALVAQVRAAEDEVPTFKKRDSVDKAFLEKVGEAVVKAILVARRDYNEAVRQYQIVHGLGPADGIVGKATIASLNPWPPARNAMLIAPRMPSSPSAATMVTRSQRPPGTTPKARSPRALQAWVRTRLVSAALSSRNTRRSGAIAAVSRRT